MYSTQNAKARKCGQLFLRVSGYKRLLTYKKINGPKIKLQGSAKLEMDNTCTMYPVLFRSSSNMVIERQSESTPW